MASCLLGRYSITVAIPPAVLYVEYFRGKVSQTICLGWPPTFILLISASSVARITGMSHWHLAGFSFFTSLQHLLLSVTKLFFKNNSGKQKKKKKQKFCDSE
jgi:hypothetical protein